MHYKCIFWPTLEFWEMCKQIICFKWILMGTNLQIMKTVHITNRTTHKQTNQLTSQQTNRLNL